MESEIIKLIASQGIFAILFTYLLFHVLKTSAEREERLMTFTKELTERMAAISERLGSIDGKVNGIADRLGKVEKFVERMAN